jgi:hypothetical protein
MKPHHKPLFPRPKGPWFVPEEPPTQPRALEYTQEQVFVHLLARERLFSEKLWPLIDILSPLHTEDAYAVREIASTLEVAVRTLELRGYWQEEQRQEFISRMQDIHKLMRDILKNAQEHLKAAEPTDNTEMRDLRSQALDIIGIAIAFEREARAALYIETTS